MPKRSLHRALVAASVLALAACGETGTPNRGLESVHQPVVERHDYALEVAAGPAGLAPGEQARLSDWFGAMRLGYGDRVWVDEAAGSRVRRDVADAVARYGLLVSDQPPASFQPSAPVSARVVVSRMRATVPGCPDFSRVTGPEFDSNTGSNHGCAINSNLAAMIADPADLVRGEPGTGIYDAQQGSKAIVTYRNAPPTGAGGTAVKADAAGGK